MNEYNAARWLLDRHVDAGDGDRVAIRCDGASTTYTGLLTSAWRAQRALRELGVGPGDRVMLIVNDEPAFGAWFLGTMRAGAIPVPLSTMLTAGELAAIAADSGARVAVASQEHVARLATVATGAPDLHDAVVLGDVPDDVGVRAHPWAAFTAETEVPVAPTTGDSPAFWLYSSGTTGRPKGVIHRHSNPQATADTYARTVLRTTADDRFLSVAKLFFAYGLGNSLTFPFAVGATAVLNPSRPTPTGVLDLVASERPTLFFASPGFVAALLDTDTGDGAFASVRYTVTAGEALPADLQKRFSARFGHPVLDGIGSTEALHIFLSNNDRALRPGTSGVPVDGYEVKLLDDEERYVTNPDTPGFLHVKGPSIAAGYWQQPDATASAFRGEWLRTGDVYTRSHDGYWTFLGRNNDMIKAGGIWVSPAEVEAVLIEHPDVLDAAVVGGRDSDGLETTVAFVVPRAGHAIDPAGIDAHCRARMAAFKRPRRLVVTDALPRTATGKVQRFRLRERLVGPGAQDFRFGQRPDG